MNQTNNGAEERLQAEIDDLKRQLAQRKTNSGGPSGRTLIVLVLLIGALAIAGYFLGYLPRMRREQVLAAESRSGIESLPVVNVERVGRSAAQSNLVLPGNIQAVAEAPVMARATGYVKKRYVDIGDRVKQGQVLADIEALELGQQIRQAKAAIDQANQTVQQAEAALVQGHANANLARVTRDRYETLFTQKVISSQERDT